MARSIVDFLLSIVTLLIFIAVLGYGAAVGVSTVLGVDFSFIQGVALILLTIILTAATKSIGGGRS